MALESSSRLGAYEILSAIGAGGMGEVYKARDTKLDRDVALKILPDAFMNDPERLARFQREAKVLASLNHPNIAAIYGLEEAAGTRALDRIAQRPIPVDEALPIPAAGGGARSGARSRSAGRQFVVRSPSRR